MLSSELYDVEILCHTVDCCDPEKIIEKIQFGQSVPQGTDENQSGICNQCGKLIDKDQDYCLNCFDLLDHNTIAADLREQKRLLEVAAHKLVSHVSIEQALECVAKSLELNLQLCADLVDEMGGCAVQPEGGDVATNLPLPSDFSEIPNLICAWCKKVLRETSSTQISHGCCDDCAERLLDEDTATSEAI